VAAALAAAALAAATGFAGAGLGGAGFSATTACRSVGLAAGAGCGFGCDTDAADEVCEVSATTFAALGVAGAAG
jgi:hypothetical protein